MRNLIADIRGNVAITASLLLLPLLLAGGMVVDYTSVSQRNNQLQGTVDAALLSIGQDGAEADLDALEGKAMEFLKANLPQNHFEQINHVTLTRDEDTGVLELTVSASYPATLMRLAGYETLDYNPSAAIKLSGGEYEIVLVLDSTFSMSADGKMDALKASARQFITDMMAFNKTKERVRIGIVPFAQYANVGTHMRGETWLEVEDDRTEHVCYMHRPVVSKSGCSMETRYNDGVPYEAEVCTSYTYGAEEEVCSDRTYTWNGCVGSRKHPLNLDDRKYSTRVPGLINTSCSKPITPLTGDRAKLESAVNALVPHGETYIPAGLTWGLRTISDGRPFSEGVSYTEAAAKDIRKVIVLMTDGENQKSAQLPGSPHHWGSDLDEANKWTRKACKKIHKKDIAVYTITFGTDVPKAARKIMKKCASAPENYYSADDSAGLAGAFNAISSELTQLYLSR